VPKTGKMRTDGHAAPNSLPREKPGHRQPQSSILHRSDKSISRMPVPPSAPFVALLCKTSPVTFIFSIRRRMKANVEGVRHGVPLPSFSMRIVG
jgi:hypothetical protein